MNKNRRSVKPGDAWKGLSIVEVMISLILVLIVVLGVLGMISAAFAGYRNAGEAAEVHQQIDEFRARLLSETFDSEKWQPGAYCQTDKNVEITWSIHLVTPSLKIAHLSFKNRRNGFVRKTSFYKSLHINTNW